MLTDVAQKRAAGCRHLHDYRLPHTVLYRQQSRTESHRGIMGIVVAIWRRTEDSAELIKRTRKCRNPFPSLVTWNNLSFFLKRVSNHRLPTFKVLKARLQWCQRGMTTVRWVIRGYSGAWTASAFLLLTTFVHRCLHKKTDLLCVQEARVLVSSAWHESSARVCALDPCNVFLPDDPVLQVSAFIHDDALPNVVRVCRSRHYKACCILETTKINKSHTALDFDKVFLFLLCSTEIIWAPR